MGCYNDNWQDDRPACTDFTFQVIIKSPPIGHATNIYGFLFTFARPVTTKFTRTVSNTQ